MAHSVQLQLLNLPPELILACLAEVPYADLSSCLATGNRLLRDLIINSPVLKRYHQEREAACVEVNPSSDAAVSDLLADLRRREEAWLHFAPQFRHTIPIDFVTSGVYDLASDVYLVGDTPAANTLLSTGLKYVHTSPGEAPQWQRLDAGKPIIDFGTALEEHDLIAVVTYTPHIDDPEMISVDVLLLKFLTGDPHPLAACPSLHIHDVEADPGRPGVTIEIVGENLAISLVYWQDDGRALDKLYLFRWKSGVQTMAPLPVNNTGLVFLTTDLLVVPTSIDAALDVYQILPPTAADPAPSYLRTTFYLPELAPLHMVITFQCRGEPNPRAGPRVRPSHAQFLPAPASALILFAFEVGNAFGSSEHMFVVDRARFATAVALCEQESEVEWSAWGPLCSRWLDAAPLATSYITTTCGTRMVSIPHDAPLQPAPIRILDFNKEHVEAQRGAPPVDGARLVEAEKEEGAVAHAPFAEPVVSLVPYVETLSTELFTYSAVLINDESIIGVKFGNAAVDSLEVLHFG
ncbi:hypothetical protein DFH09DRAFT_1152731 [Mycena vulgaris]|nr:hypothetical protein DFH09DRAFT_1152731 [Mycena vulgaris]